ncbi:hypothetical protein FRB96_005022 [Tulasnella sp. 330]|nr:hypothetical protein FRB96_005022 [Tulasnella sp. 330]KAG8878171.1 hypothetical protein FRB97_002722 [Tulasnella sp. 331]
MVWAFKGFVSYPAGPDVYFTLISIKAIDTKWIALFDFTLAAASIPQRARKKHVVILPIILEVIGIASCGVIVYYDVAAGTRLQEPGFASQIYAITVVVFIINITTTFYLTGFICYRLYSSERRTRSVDDYDVHARGSPYWKIIKVLIQSGALYSMTEATFLICILARCTNGTTVMAYLDARLIGIVTTLIVLQLNNSGDSTTTTVSLPRAHATIGTYSVRVTKHTQVDVKSDGPIEDIELSPVNPDDPIKSSVWE